MELFPSSSPDRPRDSAASQPAGPPATPPEPPGAPPAFGVATATLTLPPADPDDLPLPQGRMSTATRVLTVSVLLAVAFGGGVLAQKQNDKGMIRPPTGPLAALAAATGQGGAAAAAAGGAPGASPGEPGDHPALAAANVRGELVSATATEVVIRGKDGTELTVAIGPGTLVTRGAKAEELTPGKKVYIAAAAGPDGKPNAIALVQP